ncbi:hypothetical protein D3C72_2110580 [compost metagenome]
MRHTAHVPQLQHHAATFGVDGVSHPSPTLYLRLGVDAGREAVALALGRDLRGFAHDQPGTGALGVVGGHHCVGHITRLGAAGAGHGGHHHAVGQCERPE